MLIRYACQVCFACCLCAGSLRVPSLDQILGQAHDDAGARLNSDFIGCQQLDVAVGRVYVHLNPASSIPCG